MNYTKTIRDYCLQNKGGLFNIGKEHSEHFSMVPLKTYYKILNRLAEEKILIKQAHSVYFIVEAKNSKKKDSVVEWYGSNGHGVVLGYRWLNEIGVSSNKDNSVLIYTNRLDKNTLIFGKHRIEKVNIPHFVPGICKIIRALELIEKGHTIKDLDILQWDANLRNYLMDFNIFYYEEVIRNKEYKYSTICTLANKLTEMGYFNNDVIETYKRWYSINNIKVKVQKPFKNTF